VNLRVVIEVNENIARLIVDLPIAGPILRRTDPQFAVG
jgi:hypothetical protein